jgi:NAD(P)-dependent dehydrogenase (short-subunit alcohol dehydrogenase family)
MRSFLSVCVASLAFSVSAFAPVSLGTRSFQATNPSARAASALSMATEDGGVVITGSAGGVGFAYAGEFMDRGYDVVICDVKDCSSAAEALQRRHPNGKVFQTKCDVSDSKSVEKLAAFATKSLGTVGYWINNAGVNGGRRALSDVPISQVELVVKVNLMGTLLCTKAALDLMGAQVSASGILQCQRRCSTLLTRFLVFVPRLE